MAHKINFDKPLANELRFHYTLARAKNVTTRIQKNTRYVHATACVEYST